MCFDVVFFNYRRNEIFDVMNFRGNDYNRCIVFYRNESLMFEFVD